MRLLEYTATIQVDRRLLSAKVRTIHPAFQSENPSQVLIERFSRLSQIIFAEAANLRVGVNAGYSSQQNSLTIGLSFFSKSPIEAMLTLFHESQHQESGTPKHVF